MGNLLTISEWGSDQLRKPILAMLAVLALLQVNGAAAETKTAELIFVTSDHCIYCKAWERDVGSVYDKSPYADIATLRRVDITEIANESFTLKAPVQLTPTFIYLDGKQESGRIEGYQSADMFYWQLSEFIDFE